MKITALLILVLAFHVTAYGESVVAVHEAVSAWNEEALTASSVGNMVGSVETCDMAETELFGDIIKYLLLSVQCEAIRKTDDLGERATRISI